MNKTIIWSERAKAQLRAIDQPIALRILHALARYISTGEGDIKRLQNTDPPELRLRSGDYRLRLYDNTDRVAVLSIKHRREAYR